MPCDLPVWRRQLEMQAELKWWPHVWGIAPTNANATLSWSAPFKRPEGHRHCLHCLKAILIAAMHLRTSPTQTHQKRNSYCTAKAVRRSRWAMHFDLQIGVAIPIWPSTIFPMINSSFDSLDMDMQGDCNANWWKHCKTISCDTFLTWPMRKHLKKTNKKKYC